MSGLVESKLKKIRLIISDVDGVLTDGRIYLLGTEELKAFSVRDASPMEIARRSGLRFLFITSRKSKAVMKRARELKTDLVFKTDVKAIGGNLPLYVEKRYRVKPDEVLYVGDDWSDLYAMKLFGVSAAPSNAAPENKKTADIVIPVAGGEGVIRNVIERVMRAQGTWEKYLSDYRNFFSV